jgi:hypothetical protein
MLERKLPSESENRHMRRESAASQDVSNVREVRAPERIVRRDLAEEHEYPEWRLSVAEIGGRLRTDGKRTVRLLG